MLIRVAAAVTLMTLASPAFATVTIDQVNVTTFTNAPGNTIGSSGLASRPNQPTTQRWQAQTIVAGLTGQLTAVDLQAYIDSVNGDLLVMLGNGEVTTPGYSTVGTITLAHTAVATYAGIASGGFTSVDLSSLNYFVTAGQKFTIMLAASTPAPTANGGHFFAWSFGELDANGAFVSQADYAPGVNRISTDSGQTWGISGADRGFRTYVNVAAVPEPATWGMMTLGFGAMGGAMRYRRRMAKVVYT